MRGCVRAWALVAGLFLPGAVLAQQLTTSVIDLSSHNEVTIDARMRARRAGSVLIHRSTIRLDVRNFSDADFRFEERLAQAAAHGYGLGAYHVGTRTGSGSQQADDFLKVVKSACDRLPSARRRILLAVDWEPTTSDPDNFMSPVELESFIRRAMARTGKAITVYSFENFLKYRQGDIAERPTLWRLLGSLPLWVASLRLKAAACCATARGRGSRAAMAQLHAVAVHGRRSFGDHAAACVAHRRPAGRSQRLQRRPLGARRLHARPRLGLRLPRAVSLTPSRGPRRWPAP